MLDEIDSLLAEHVNQGHVDYAKLSQDLRLQAAIDAFANQTWPQSPKQLAFWMNAYNLATLHLICRSYPVKSIGELHQLKPMPLAVATKRSAWDVFLYKVDGKKRSLNTIEHKIIRKRFDEPRIHAALVCAAKSCPPLRNELYRDEALDAQLDAQMHDWINDTTKIRVDRERGVLYLSEIFRWYKRDFTKTGRSITEWIQAYVEPPCEGLKAFKIKYMHYDWALNGS